MDNNAIRQADAVALADRVGELLNQIRCTEAELGVVIVEIEDRGVEELFGCRSVPRLLEELADVSAYTARKLVRRAQALNPSHATRRGSAEPGSGKARSPTTTGPLPCGSQAAPSIPAGGSEQRPPPGYFVPAGAVATADSPKRIPLASLPSAVRTATAIKPGTTVHRRADE